MGQFWYYVKELRTLISKMIIYVLMDGSRGIELSSSCPRKLSRRQTSENSALRGIFT